VFFSIDLEGLGFCDEYLGEFDLMRRLHEKSPLNDTVLVKHVGFGGES
jgi:hypothetical protein